jgi:aspartate/methionine/tyrosine aminotransferase
MIPPEELQGLATYCHTNGIRLISDEIYHRLSYGTVPEATAIQYSPSTLVINSFSKYYCMTGWRLGWMVVPDDMIDNINKLCQNMYISAPTISQHAALAAFDCTTTLNQRKQAYLENLQLLKEGLPLCGFKKFVVADGAFYLYCDVTDITDGTAGF